MAHFLVLSCLAMRRSVYAAAEASGHTFTIHHNRLGLHDRPAELRRTLQEQIDGADAGTYQAILLAYGLCGLATSGLVAGQIPLVIPRAHDCVTLILGSRQRYAEEFNRHPGTYWFSVDYLEQAENGGAGLGAAGFEEIEAQRAVLAQKYGARKAEALLDIMRQWTAHYTRAVFVDTGLGDGNTYLQKARSKASKEGWSFEIMRGDRRLLSMMLSGEWDAREFLVVPPGWVVQPSYDESIVKAVPFSKAAGQSDDG